MSFKFRPVPLAVAYGRTDSVKNSGGVLINCYAERAPEDAKNPVTLVGAPGQFPFATLDIAPNIGPVCDAIVVNERPYFVTTKGLYKITNAAGTVRKLGALTVNAQAMMASKSRRTRTRWRHRRRWTSLPAAIFSPLPPSPLWTVISCLSALLPASSSTRS